MHRCDERADVLHDRITRLRPTVVAAFPRRPALAHQIKARYRYHPATAFEPHTTPLALLIDIRDDTREAVKLGARL
jgi:hypothetical protein